MFKDLFSFKYQRSINQLFNKMPCEHLFKENARDLKTLARSHEKLHRLNKAYLQGIFGSNVCRHEIQKESTTFQEIMAHIGIGKVITSMAKHKELAREEGSDNPHDHDQEPDPHNHHEERETRNSQRNNFAVRANANEMIQSFMRRFPNITLSSLQG